MSSIITAGNATNNGTSISSDTSGILELKTGSTPTTALTLDTSGNLKFNSGYGSVATAYGCRAWVNFDGTGTPAIRASANVSSITDNGIGDYTVNFTTAMPDANYCAIGTTGPKGANSEAFTILSYVSASAVRINTSAGAGVPGDCANNNFAVFR